MEISTCYADPPAAGGTTKLVLTDPKNSSLTWTSSHDSCPPTTPDPNFYGVWINVTLPCDDSLVTEYEEWVITEGCEGASGCSGMVVVNVTDTSVCALGPAPPPPVPWCSEYDTSYTNNADPTNENTTVCDLNPALPDGHTSALTSGFYYDVQPMCGFNASENGSAVFVLLNQANSPFTVYATFEGECGTVFRYPITCSTRTGGTFKLACGCAGDTACKATPNITYSVMSPDMPMPPINCAPPPSPPATASPPLALSPPPPPSPKTPPPPVG